jgi:hypothetical protein
LVSTGPFQGTYDYCEIDPVTKTGAIDHTLGDVLPHWTQGSEYFDGTAVY